MASLGSEELKEAVRNGDVEFLRKCVASNQPLQYYMATFPRIDDDGYYHGNIFHIGAREGTEEFIREAIGMLPAEATQQLLVQPRPPIEGNPLHVAAEAGNVEIVKMFVNVFASLPSNHHHQSQSQPQPPWLLKNSKGDTPCHVALYNDNDECALEMFKRDKELLLDISFPDGDNIYHFAADGNRKDLIREAIQMLPVEHTQRLLLQTAVGDANPLHYAVCTGNAEIVKMFLAPFRSAPLPPDPSKRPWLRLNDRSSNPCFCAVYEENEDCALEILKIDKETLCNELSYRGSHLLYEAILYKFTKLALEILTSRHPIGWAGKRGRTPFHTIDHLEDSDDSKAIFRLLVEKEPKTIEQKDEDECSVFHAWADSGRVWPFKSLLESKSNIQNVLKVFVGLIGHRDCDGDSPLHTLALNAQNEEASIEISKLLVDTYNCETSSISDDDLPWLVPNNNGDTALSLAVDRKFQKLALYLLSEGENAITKGEVLFLAIEKGCHEVAKKIMEIIENKQWTQLLTNRQQQNVLHFAPLCTNDFVTGLMERHSDLIKGVAKGGETILHSWIRNGNVGLFELTLKSTPLIINLLDVADHINRNSPFHIAAITNRDETTRVVELLVKAYKENNSNWSANPISALPWFTKNKKAYGPLELAIKNNSESLALYILSLYEPHDIDKLLDYYRPRSSVLFLAMRYNCTKVAKQILARLDKKSRTHYLEDSSDGENILHVALELNDKEFGAWLVGEASEYIVKENEDKRTPLDEASRIGATWFIQAALKKDPSVLQKVPLAWVKACENGHISAVRAFVVHNPGKFRDECIRQKDSPLHHINLQSLTDYEALFKIPRMKDLINLQNVNGDTPLHIALRNGDISLAEILLSMDNIRYNVKNKEDKSTAIDILEQVCGEKEEWEAMCYRNGLDPYVKTSYFQRKTNLLEVRSSLFVVAALLATITFTAGFTLPGGLNQESGVALLAKKPGFLAFLMFDTLGMCSSTLVLICLVWSMVPMDSEKAVGLIDRSMMIIMVAFYSTLLAFMTGVYIVVSPNVLWAAITVIVMCSLIGISAHKGLLYRILLISSKKNKNHQVDRLKRV